jgi:hypothetical protein
MKYKIRLLVCFLALSLSTACEGTKDQLGLTRTAPDEFAVMKRAPLEIPPDYSLRPPRPGAARPQEMDPEKKAEKALFGENKASGSTAPENGETALLQQAGTDIAQPDIRSWIDRETSIITPKEKPVAERLIGWTTGSSDHDSASVVDAKGEAERIRKNIEEGRPVTEGETPSIED